MKIEMLRASIYRTEVVIQDCCRLCSIVFKDGVAFVYYMITRKHCAKMLKTDSLIGQLKYNAHIFPIVLCLIGDHFE